MRFVATLVLATGLLSAARAEDPSANWPHWRGPLNNGVAPAGDPPVTWDAKTHVRWKAALPGRGSASPIVWGDQVFVATAIETDRVAGPDELPKVDPRLPKRTDPPKKYHQFIVLSFDRATGRERWRHVAAERVPHEGHHLTHSYCGGSPTTDGRFLYVSFGSFGTYCYDLDGKPRWSRDFGRLNTRLGWGEAVTPVVHGDALLLNLDQETGSALVCLDARTGATRWKADRTETTTWSTPLVVEHGGRAQVVANGTKRIRCYDLETGKELWQCGGMTPNPIPSPVSANGVVYCVSGYTSSAARAIPLGLTGDLTDSDQLLWRHDRGTPYVASPLLYGERLWFTQERFNLLTTLDVKTGKAILDRVRLPNVSQFYASPVAAAGRVYLVDRDGTTLVLKAGDTLEVLATNRLDDPIDASPAVVGKQLFLRAATNLYCIAAD
jgi:outer membrane protein assembly factor BamB